jgi:Arc/MetJ-type ribon-helix-helix transcriptional regulator
MAQEIHVLNVRLPDDTIQWIDSLVKQGVFNSRSEAIRAFIRDNLKEGER